MSNKTLATEAKQSDSHAVNHGRAGLAQNSRLTSRSQTLISVTSKPFIRPKLRIGAPNDKYELEADRVADQVMSMPEAQFYSSSDVPPPPANNGNSTSGFIQRTCASCAKEYQTAEQEERLVISGNLCPKCRVQAKPLMGTITALIQRQESEEDEEETIQAKASGQTPAVTPDIARGIQSFKGGGQPLPESGRHFFESRFGHDFSQVRIHADHRAANLAQSINARAFTLGRDVVFGAGEYSSSTSAGRKLLAHELAHVVQQKGGSAIQKRTPTAAIPFSPQPIISRAPTRIQRLVKASVESRLEGDSRDAAACLIHLHPNEQNALEVAKDLNATHCTNLMFLRDTSGRSTPNRTIEVEVNVNSSTETCHMDSNRIFSDAGRSNAFSGCSDDAKIAAATEAAGFVSSQLGPAISRCRGGTGDAAMTGRLPILAFHNNTNTTAPTIAGLRQASLNIHWYEAGGRAARDAEQDPAILGSRTNPAIVQGQDPDNFFLVTRLADFDALSGSRNVVLQARPPNPIATTPSPHRTLQDDGSLSVVLNSERYINIESEGKAFRGHGHGRYLTNRSMALEVFRHLGVPQRPCIGARRDDIQQRGAQRISEVDTRATQSLEQVERWRDLARPQLDDADEIADRYSEAVIDRRNTMRRITRFDVIREVQALERSIQGRALPCPASVTGGGRSFCSTRELQNHKAMWSRRIADMQPDNVIEWFVGQLNCANFASRLRRTRRRGGFLSPDQHDRTLICEAFEESQAQIDALRAAIPAAMSSARGSRQPLRDFASQQGIWESKYRFTITRPFGSIRQDSQDTCVAHIGGTPTQQADLRTRVFPVGGEWDTSDAQHQQCWTQALTPEQRQREILQTSSAPGISRHHQGADIDLGGSGALTNTAWPSGSDTPYDWLQQNALAYGFIQPFSAGRSAGYLEERWHWSYYPIAQALVEFANSHQTDIENRLNVLWDARLQAMINAGQIPRAASGTTQEDPYSHVRANWRDFIFNVEQQPT